MSGDRSQIEAFNELVALKYQLYNGLFLTLPFQDLADTGVQLPIFAQACREQLAQGKPPREIVEAFFRSLPGRQDFKARIRILFKFLQFIERQVVLFDALEDAAFEQVNDMKGPGTLDHFLDRVREARRLDRLEKEVEEYKVRIVLTAHPTQFYPSSILGIITDLCEAVKTNQLNEINRLLLQMGKTQFRNREAPTPLDEAKSLIWYLENIFYQTLPRMQASMARGLDGNGRLVREGALARPKLELGFWPGGDRDGNPNVTTETTLAVAGLLKASLINLYLADLRNLKRRLTFEDIPGQLAQVEEKLIRTALTGAGEMPLPLHPLYPANFVTLKKKVNRGGYGEYGSSEDALEDLAVIRQNLVNKHHGLFLEILDEFILKLRIFGFHFATIDLRQDSRIHSAAVTQIFRDIIEQGSADTGITTGMQGYSHATREEKISFLERLQGLAGIKIPAAWNGLDAISLDTLASLSAARTIRQTNGHMALHRYIISNTQSAVDVLEVMALARISGWKRDEIGLDIVPLFETIADLENSGGIMAQLYANRVYAAHLARKGNVQTIMLGFSDGTKDGGYLTANWAIRRAKEILTRLSREAGIKVIFFDGRGGPPARGGGNTHKFYRSLGPTIEHGEIQLTVQGQTISSNFGTPEAARFNLEQLFTAGLEDKVFPETSEELSPPDIELLEKMSRISSLAYREFKGHELFLPYLEEMTPLGYSGMLNIGSRPAKRKSSGSLRLEDLRAIPFVGAWSQMKQNIPGFYGFGIALRTLSEAGKRKELRELYRKSLFFRTLVENAMMSLSKSYFPLTQYLRNDPRFGGFWQIIYDEATLSKSYLKEITGQKKLLETAGPIRESIHIREKIVLPLLTIQQYAMDAIKQIRTGKAKKFPKDAPDIFRKMVVKSMAANINASRNSA